MGVRSAVDRLFTAGTEAMRWLWTDPNPSPRRRSALGIVALTVLVIAFGVAASSNGSRASASPGTCSTPSTGQPHNMYYKNPDRGSVHGVTSAVTVRTSGLCTGTNTFANSYTMLYCGDIYTSSNVCDFNGWAQSGFIKWRVNPEYSEDDDITVTFAQYANHSDLSTIYGTRHLTAGDTYHYKSEYVKNGCGQSTGQLYNCIYVYVDSTILQATDFDPAGYWPSIGLEYAQEARYNETDVPGLSTSPVAFSGMQYKTTTGSWMAVDSTLLEYRDDNPTGRWGHQPVTVDHKDLFTANP